MTTLAERRALGVVSDADGDGFAADDDSPQPDRCSRAGLPAAPSARCIAWGQTAVTAAHQIALLIAARRKCGVWTHASIRVLWTEARRLLAQRKAV